MTEPAREITFFESIALTAESMGRENFTEPDDDWVPIMFMLGEEDGKPISSMASIGHFMDSDHSKDMLATMVIPAMIRKFQAKTVVLLLNVWTAQEPMGGWFEHRQGEFIQPSQRPDRQEALTLAEYTRQGLTRYAQAKINRYEYKPPDLDEWVDLPLGEDGAIEGRFVEPIVKAMQSLGT